MAKDEIDDLIAAVEAVEFLKDAVARQAKSINLILAELERVKLRLDRVETMGGTA